MSQRPSKTIKAIAIACGYPPTLGGKTPVLSITYSDSKGVLTRKLTSCRLALMVLEGSEQAAGVINSLAQLGTRGVIIITNMAR